MKKLILYLASVVLSVSCAGNKSSATVGQIKVDFEAPAPEWKVTKVVPLETNKKAFYNRFFRIRVTDRNIFIQDDQQVLVFDLNGRYISKIQHVGHGPQEYVRISNFWISGDEVYIVNGMADKILIYSLTGDFLRSIPVDIKVDAIAVSDEYMALQSTYNQNGTLIVTDRDGRKLYETIAPILAKTTVSMPANFPLTEAGGKLYYFPDFSSSIYTVGADTSDVREISFDFGVHTITPEFVSTLTAPTIINEFIEHEIICFPSFNPTQQWWGMVFSLGDKEYSWYYDTKTGGQYISAAEGLLTVKPIACATEHFFVASVEAPVFLEDDRFAAYRDGISVKEDDNAVLIFYTVE